MHFSENVSLPGEFLGVMSTKVVKEMGLEPTCQVAVSSSIIDAHSGVLAMVTLFLNAHRARKCSEQLDVESIFSSIAGTSTCHMVLNAEKCKSPGIWGPYYNVILKNYFVREPGQSATGKLLEHVVRSHPDYHTIYKGYSMTDIFVKLNALVEARRATFSKNTLHVNPSFHGNRCPLADPTLKGLKLEESTQFRAQRLSRKVFN